MASLAGRTQGERPHACHLPMWCEKGYEIIILICLPSPPPFRVVWEERPQALQIDSISPTSFWLHLLSTLPFLTLSLTAPHPNLYSSLPRLIHPFHLFSSSCALLLFFTKIIRLHVPGTSISSEHILSCPSSPLLLFHFFQELAKAMLFQIIQLLKLILREQRDIKSGEPCTEGEEEVLMEFLGRWEMERGCEEKTWSDGKGRLERELLMGPRSFGARDLFGGGCKTACKIIG